jgi:enolase
MYEVSEIHAIEILDSRGKPTVKATCALASGASASASVPSGASTGKAEARELRDGDPNRYRGLGCRKAAANVSGPIASALRGREFPDQASLDGALLELDGTPDKSNLGANAILATSIAFARAVARERHVPLYQHFADMIGQALRTLPRLTVNLFSGGKHAGGQVPFQDVLIVPASAKTIDEGLAVSHAVYQSAAKLAHDKYGMRLLRADEGGLAPPFENVRVMLEDTHAAIEAAGFKLLHDVAIAIDVAASHFFRDGKYDWGKGVFDAHGQILRLATLAQDFGIVSIEDGLAENDWVNWPHLRNQVKHWTITLGDDLLCTNPQRIRRAIDEKAADALLLKVNQIGTLTEAAEALKLARSAGWVVTISARSGETEDDWLADLAVGWGGDQIKVGSITQSERLAKYNRLLEIESETKLPIVDWPSAPPLKHHG